MINTSKIKMNMPILDLEKRLKSFDEVELGLSDELALSEASRCLNCKSKPCMKGCPVGVEIPKFINFIVNKDLQSAYRVIKKDNSFPAVCGRVCPQEKQCEAQCVRNKSGESVAIGRLERYVADKHMEIKGATTEQKKINISESKLHKIAIVGSGPSGLTCASELADLGFEVTIFEALHTPGGVLAYGIPEFRLPRKILDFEVENLKSKGVKIVTDVVIGKSLSVDDLFLEGFSAVYIACGAGLPRFMNIPGEGLAGVYSSNEFLTRINLMKAYDENYDTPIVIPENVVIVGGGNVAMDAARCAKRIGAEKVTVMYRRTEEEMPARKDEIKHAKEEGIQFLFLSNPIEFLGKDGKVQSIKYVKMELVQEESVKRKSVKIASDEKFELIADTVVVAVGNNSNSIIKDSGEDISFDDKGRIITDTQTTKTSRDFVYAGGDIVTGAATVILAMGAGKRAANQINNDLKLKY